MSADLRIGTVGGECMGGCCGGDRPYYREEAERRDRESRDAEQRDHKEKSEAEYQKQQYENNQRQNSEGGTSQAGDAGLGCFFIIIILLGLSLLKVMAVVETSAANKIAAEDAERVDGLRSRIKATLTGAVDQRADAVPFLPIDDEIEALHSSSLRLEVGKAREECLL
ncbi:MAG TPA: hypothetical protein PLY87_21490 [Planctomycetaceae bacterium]|nr:hypothetical protein [Planctomycetaceae bacterium]